MKLQPPESINYSATVVRVPNVVELPLAWTTLLGLAYWAIRHSRPAGLRSAICESYLRPKPNCQMR